MNKRAWDFRSLSTMERIAHQTERHGDCLIFKGANVGGYGRLRHEGKSQLAHRVVWSAANGKIPDGKVIMHTCDNPGCVEISHLRLGTQADNIADMVGKGRRVIARGARSNSKLCDDDVIMVKHWIKENHHLYKIANAFGVTEGLIRQIRAGRAWAHISLKAA